MAGQKFDEKSFNPQAFGSYVERVPNTKKNEFLKAGILRGDANVRSMFANQTGSYYGVVPMYGLIGGTTVNYDGQTNITASSSKTFEQGITVIGRAAAWTEKDFSYDITSGVDFMSNVGDQVAMFWDTEYQGLILSILKGVFSMTGGDNKKFVDEHTLDIKGAGTAADPGTMTAATLNTAIQKACGDNKNIFKVAIMHSAVATHLENLRLLDYLKYTDANGIQRDLAIATWNGRTVLIDDSVPTSTISKSGTEGEPGYVAAGTAYTTYLFGEGSIIYEDLGAKVPYEMDRDPAKNGGETTLYSRRRIVLAPKYISYTKSSQTSLSPTSTELETAANWALVSDGAATVDRKAIAIARIISR